MSWLNLIYLENFYQLRNHSDPQEKVPASPVTIRHHHHHLIQSHTVVEMVTENPCRPAWLSLDNHSIAAIYQLWVLCGRGHTTIIIDMPTTAQQPPSHYSAPARARSPFQYEKLYSRNRTDTAPSASDFSLSIASQDYLRFNLLGQ